MSSNTPSTFSFGRVRALFSGIFRHKKVAKEQKVLLLADYQDVPVPKNRFLEAAARVFDSAHFAASASADAPYGYFRGRPILGDCTRFSGGIYVGHQAHEAVVIDERYEVLPNIYGKLLDRISDCSANPVFAEYEIFNHVTTLVNEVITIDALRTKDFIEIENIKADEKISLDVFITQGFGFDYHQVLLAGYLLEKLTDQKKLVGVVSLDSALSDGALADLVLLYTSSTGATFRFCPNQRRILEIVH